MNSDHLDQRQELSALEKMSKAYWTHLNFSDSAKVTCQIGLNGILVQRAEKKSDFLVPPSVHPRCLLNWFPLRACVSGSSSKSIGLICILDAKTFCDVKKSRKPSHTKEADGWHVLIWILRSDIQYCRRRQGPIKCFTTPPAWVFESHKASAFYICIKFLMTPACRFRESMALSSARQHQQ